MNDLNGIAFVALAGQHANRCLAEAGVPLGDVQAQERRGSRFQILQGSLVLQPPVTHWGQRPM
ncbi:MAG: hypothetical protein ACE5LU_20475 [Anaerolineae bacterium]